MRPLLPCLTLLLLLSSSAPVTAAVYTWVDEEGITHISDDPAALPEAVRGQAREGREGLRDSHTRPLLGAKSSASRNNPVATMTMLGPVGRSAW